MVQSLQHLNAKNSLQQLLKSGIYKQKRRKIPRNIPISQSATALPTIVVPEVDITDGGIQTETPKVVSGSDIEVATATAALNLTNDPNEQDLGENWLWK